MEKSPNPAPLIRYLLGDLSQAEQERLEEEFFSDNDLFVELLDTEDQLVSDYLSGRLSPGDRNRFERRFLTLPDRRRSLELACLLQSSVRQPLTEQPNPDDGAVSWRQSIQSILGALRARRPLTGLAMTVLLIAGIIGVRSVMQLSSEKGQTDLGQSSRPKATGPAVISLTLKPGRFRDRGNSQKATVGPATQVVELRLEDGMESYQSYQAGLQKVGDGGAEILTESALEVEKAGSGPVVVIWKVPATKLTEGDYQIKLNGVGVDNSISNIGTYHFEVRER